MSGRLNKIEKSLAKADLILRNIEEQTMDPRPIESGGGIGVRIVTPPGVNPGSLSTHGYNFPWWLLPPDPANPTAHPMYQIWLSMPASFRNILNFGNFLSLLRFVIAPHIPNTLFTRIPGLRKFLDSYMGRQAQNVLRDLLRSWMLNNLNIPQDVLEGLYPGVFGPYIKPGTPAVIPGGIKPIGGGGVIPPPTGGGFISDLVDTMFDIVPNLITVPLQFGEQTSPMERMKDKHQTEKERLRTKHEREIDMAQRRERNRRRTQRQG